MVTKRLYTVEQMIPRLFGECDHLVLATADDFGTPWITPLRYHVDGHNNIYWMSSKNSRHSINISYRSEVSIVIMSNGPKIEALYIEAKANEVNNKSEIDKIIKLIKQKPQPKLFEVNSYNDLSGKSSWRLYKAEPVAFYERDKVFVDGKLNTVRKRIR